MACDEANTEVIESRWWVYIHGYYLNNSSNFTVFKIFYNRILGGKKL